MTQKYTTSDWQWFLQDIATQIDEQMKPDANEVERYQASVAKRSNSDRRPSQQQQQQQESKLSPRRSGSSSTKVEEDGIEMPALPSTSSPRGATHATRAEPIHKNSGGKEP